MTPGKLRTVICTQRDVETGSVGADALISITGHGAKPVSVDTTRFGGHVLRLVFDDIPSGVWTDEGGKVLRGPLISDLEGALSFARSATRGNGDTFVVAVQGLHAKSRSAAVALMLLAESFGPGKEESAVRSMLVEAGKARINPNPGIVRAADSLLRRGTAIEDALTKHCKRFGAWRDYWNTRVPSHP